MRPLRTVAIVITLWLGAACAPAPQAPPAPRPRLDLPTPMPDAFDVELPRRDLPVAAAGLAGIWKGEWLARDQAAGSPGTPHVLVVKRIEGAPARLTAPVIWSVGAPVGESGAGEAGFVELSGVVTEDGVLRVAVPARGDVVYRLSPSGRELVAEAVVGGRTLRATLTRYPEWGAPPDARGRPGSGLTLRHLPHRGRPLAS